MSTLQIILLIVGIVIFVVSFFIPGGKENELSVDDPAVKKELKKLVTEEIEDTKEQIDGMINEAIDLSMDKTERKLERLTNEKIMAVNEYSDTVLAEIHKNHEETMFLYDMLNDKHQNIKNTVSEVNKTVKKVEEKQKEVIAEKTPVSAENLEAEPQVSAAPEKKPAKKKTPATKEEKKVKEFVPFIPEVTINKPTVGEDKAPANNNERILELHKQGKSSVAIAKELGLGVGEVKLVIDLFKNIK
ncbi:MAG: hypothetical protein J6033_07600 [Lachnospiraceae bacterium]|nr:hypothetical protein [Lachnospiraceae bacterium]